MSTPVVDRETCAGNSIEIGKDGPAGGRGARRQLLVAVAMLPLIAFPARRAYGQQKKIRIGYLSIRAKRAVRAVSEQIFLDRLRELGYEEGRNVVIERRFAAGRVDRLPSLAAELVRLEVEVIVTQGIASALAARQASGTIPIVMGNASDDPVRRGLAGSLARPGGNVTGFIDVSDELAGKRLDLLKQLVPKASRIAILWNPDSPAATAQIRGVQEAGQLLGLELQTFETWRPENIETTFQAASRWGAGALFVITQGLFNGHAERVVRAANKTQIPAMYSSLRFVAIGGVIAYSPDTGDQYRQAATYVDRILRGAKPAELPIVQPTKFELAINMKTARALGLTVPPEIMVQATRVIQ